ncbi:hypothetical protein AWB65_06807 [Caballeronia humi]|uniref:Uncharacterized protein n=1 Tax=Caballeronia humi TaxID=326474 RepID=A0A158JL86_9BURK|nr:hypothetical protein AWB65_06807 [Caballeronia humi]
MPARAELRTPGGRHAGRLPLRRSRCEGHRRYGLVGAVPGPRAQRADRHRARGEQGRQDRCCARRTVSRSVPDDAFATFPAGRRRFRCRASAPAARLDRVAAGRRAGVQSVLGDALRVLGNRCLRQAAASDRVRAREPACKRRGASRDDSDAGGIGGDVVYQSGVARPATGDREGHDSEPRRFGESVQPALQVRPGLANGAVAEPVRIRIVAGNDPPDRTADRAAGKFAVDPARPQPAVDHARPRNRRPRAARRAGGPAVGTAHAPSRPAAGRAEPDRGQRADRRGAGALLPVDFTDGPLRHREQSVLEPLHGAGARVVVRRLGDDADFHGGQHRRSGEAGRGAAATGALFLSKGDSGRVPGSRRFADRAAEIARGARRAGPRGRCAADLRAARAAEV